jgi:hypothetical protein
MQFRAISTVYYKNHKKRTDTSKRQWQNAEPFNIKSGGSHSYPCALRGYKQNLDVLVTLKTCLVRISAGSLTILMKVSNILLSPYRRMLG